LVVVAELISCLSMAFTLLEVDAALCKQAPAKIGQGWVEQRGLDLHEKMQRFLVWFHMFPFSYWC
jgi:hypothetical protein